MKVAEQTNPTVDQAGRIAAPRSASHQGHHLDRAADQSAGPERHDRGGSGRRSGQGLRGGRQRGQGTGQGNRQGNRGHQPEDRGDSGRHRRVPSRRSARSAKSSSKSTTFPTRSPARSRSRTATTNEIGRNVTEAARGSSEIAGNIGRVADAAQSTTHGATDSLKAAQELARMSTELRELVHKMSKA